VDALHKRQPNVDTAPLTLARALSAPLALLCALALSTGRLLAYAFASLTVNAPMQELEDARAAVTQLSKKTEAQVTLTPFSAFHGYSNS
jgi:hypothetical protein